MTSAQRRGNALPRASFGDLLVGFKYAADVLKRLERGDGYAGEQCSPDRLVLAAEESHGVIMPPGIRDKDASPACMYLAALHQRETAAGRYLARLLRRRSLSGWAATTA